jgi:hypothetical protein
MPSKFAEVSSRNFNPMLHQGLSDAARKAVNAAFDAMSTWRTETVKNSENFERVIDKMAEAARALGWPQQIADATRVQMESVAKMRIQMMDKMIDAWEEQIKSPSSPSALLFKLKSLPTFSATGNWPRALTSQMTAFNPFGVYMQIAEQWQKACADTMAFWTKAGELNSWRARL